MAKQIYPKDQIQNMIINEALAQGVDPKLALALAKQESGYNPYARSKVGAMGVMQLMPNTARGLGVTDPYDPQQNIRAGIRMIKGLVNKYGNDTPRVLAAYNAGSVAVDDYRDGTNKSGQNPKHRKGVMPYNGTGYKETKGYVNNILSMINNANSEINKFASNHPVLSTIYQSTPIGSFQRLVDANFRIGNKLGNMYNNYKQNPKQVSTSGTSDTVTGEASPVVSNIPTSGTLPDVSVPNININTPQLGSPSGIASSQLAQNVINEMPTLLKQALIDYSMGNITKAQLVGMHGNELAAAGIDIDKLPESTPFKTSALSEADRIAEQLKVSPEDVQKLNEQTYGELAKQRDLVAQQQQSMVDRLNAMQQRYDDIINSDPRLQTGQGYYINPRDIASNNAAQVANQIGGFGMNLPTAEALAKQRYEAQLSNQLGVPYADYSAAKQQAIQNQLSIAPQVFTAQNTINNNTRQMVDQLTTALTTMSEFGYDALTDNQKNLVDLYKPILENITSGEYDIQKDVANRYNQIQDDRLQAMGQLYSTDVGATTTTTGNILSNQAAQQRNTFDYLTAAQKNYIDASRVPYQNYLNVGEGLGYGSMGGLTPEQNAALLQGITGINIPQGQAYQPQGLWSR